MNGAKISVERAKNQVITDQVPDGFTGSGLGHMTYCGHCMICFVYHILINITVMRYNICC